jgi:hypothetical protein
MKKHEAEEIKQSKAPISKEEQQIRLLEELGISVM